MMRKKFRNTQSGFSLLELLLTVGVLSILFAAGAAIFDDWQQDAIDRKAAREIQELQNAAERYVELNINAISDALPTVGDSIEIPLSDLQAGAFIPPGYDGVNSYRQSMRAFVRYASATTAYGDTFEVITVTDNVGASNRRVEDNRLFNAATSGQRSVGIISDVSISATCCDGNIQSAYGGWSIPITSIPAYTTRPGPEGGYLAAYGRVFSDELLANNYLYRFEVPEIPNANRMEVDLGITDHDIENTGAIIADSVQGSNVTVAGNAYSRLPGTYSLMVDTSMEMDTMDILLGGNDQKGNLSVEGSGSGPAFTVNGDVTVLNAATGDGNVSANNLDADAATVAGESNFNFVSNNGSDATAGVIFMDSALYNQSLNVSNNMQASSVTNFDQTNSGSLATGELVSSASIDAAGNVQADNNMNILGNTSTGAGIIGTGKVTIGTLNCNDTDPGDCP